ncbi:MAG TPA: glycosyltransferase family 4 protein [Caldilineae bacterium]|nr:glycosyltransferase family 4 protein [Caldilineae bacterium]HIQ12758.1 glycosyltransferase [Caldilineales bacterium]
MPTILFLRSSSHLGGIERQMLWHAARLQADGWDVRVACLHRGQGEHPMVLAARMVPLPAETLPDPAFWRPRAAREVRALIQCLRPDIIHTADYRTDILVAGKLEGARWLAESQGHTEARLRMKAWNWLDMRALRRAHGAAPVSAAWETWLAARGVSPARMTRLENSRAILRSGPMPAPAHLYGPGPHLLYAGRLSPEKGIDLLLAAWSAIRGRWPNASLWVLGALPPAGRFRRRIQRGLTQPGVHYLGHQPDIRPWLQTADAVLVPSRREAWGMTAFEALCVGTPLVAARVGGLPALCRSAPHARLFTRDDAHALISALEQALSPGFPRGAGVGRAYCMQPRFDPHRRHAILMGIYERLLL